MQPPVSSSDLGITYGLGKSSLGFVLVALSQRGVCAIFLGDDAASLTAQIQSRFPGASLTSVPSLDELVAQVVGAIEDPTVGLGLALDLRGTAFQRRVWHELEKIPAGTTTSYAAIAERIGSPQSARAVAHACAANLAALAIPCHRVVRADGGISGYRWGVARKRQLLAREAHR